METEYLIYNQRLGGFINRTGGLISDWEMARRFSWEEAVEVCRAHRDHRGLASFPIAVTDIEKVLEEKSE